MLDGVGNNNVIFANVMLVSISVGPLPLASTKLWEKNQSKLEILWWLKGGVTLPLTTNAQKLLQTKQKNL